MRRAPLISLSVKAGLVLFVVVAGALAIVYLAVVPAAREPARRREDRASSSGRRPTSASSSRDLDFIAMDDVVRTQGESLDARA